MYITADTVDDAMRRAYRKLLISGQAINPSRGAAVEIRGAVLLLTNPRARLSRSASRGRLFSALGEFLWYLARTDSLEFIRYYIPEYAESSDDGKTIHGAYGPRLFNDGGVDQVANIIDLLRDRPDSRREVIQLFRSTDILQPHRDVPCTCFFQFMLRNNKLDLIAAMRSNDAFLGLPHDVFTFTMLQELVARSIGADLGQYHHMVGSFHLYDRDRRAVRQYIGEGWQSKKAMPPMPSGNPWKSVKDLLAAERIIRKGGRPTLLGLPPYWKDLVRLLRIYRLWQQGRPRAIDKLKRQMSTSVYRPYIETRQQMAEERGSTGR